MVPGAPLGRETVSIPSSQLDVKQKTPKGLAVPVGKDEQTKKQAHTMQREEKDQPIETQK